MKTPYRLPIISLLILGVILTACTCTAESGSSDANKALVETNLLPYHIIEGQSPYTLQSRMAHYHVPGVSIAVIDNFEIKWVAYYGVKSSASDVPIDGDTRFKVGSLSKAMTSVCILSLVEKGKIDLNGDVNPQLKSWKIPPNEFTALAPVTPLLLMNHSAGMPHRAPFSYTVDKMPTTMQMINGEPPSRSNALRVFQKPGSGFQYSNGGFTVLQILTEDVTGLPFDEAVLQQVLSPLGMDYTTFTTPLPASLMPHAASGHSRSGELLSSEPRWMAHVAAGGLWTTAEDYARFLVELQKSVHGKSNRLFSRDLTLEMLSPHEAAIYGLGVFLYEGNGEEPFFSHIGDGLGFVGGFASHRDAGCGAVVLTNGMDGINLCREVLRSVAQVYEWPGYLPQKKEEFPVSQAELKTLVGRYRMGIDTLASLTAEDGLLKISSAGLPEVRLYRVAADTFVCLERKGEIVIGMDQGQKIAHMDYRLSDDIGRVKDQPTRAVHMATGQSTALELLLAGHEESALAQYLEFQVKNPSHQDIKESRFNRLGYRLVGEKDMKGALAVFKLNTLLYPESGNVFDSYGEALLAVGRKEEAIANYKKSLELNPDNTNAADILKDL